MLLPVPYEILWDFHKNFKEKTCSFWIFHTYKNFSFFSINLKGTMFYVFIRQPATRVHLFIFWGTLEDPVFWQSSVVFNGMPSKDPRSTLKKRKSKSGVPLCWELYKLQLVYSASAGWYLNFKTPFLLSFLVTQENKSYYSIIAPYIFMYVVLYA